MPASMTIALVASSPKVTGSRMLMPDSGPMPGSTPTSVPTRQPRKPYHSTSGRSATENPSIRLSKVSNGKDPINDPILESQDALLERRFEHDGEERVGGDADAEAVGRGRDEVAALERDEGEQHQRHGEDEAERGVERDGRRRDGEHADRVRQLVPRYFAKRHAGAAAGEEDRAEHDHQGAHQLRHHAGARERQRAERQVAARRKDRQRRR